MRIRAALVGVLFALGLLGATSASGQEVCLEIQVQADIQGNEVTFDLERDAGVRCLPPT